LKIRNYDEVNQFQRVLDETISQKSLDFKQINQELRQRKVNFELLKKKHFPKIERAASILTMISIPIGISGVAASSLATSLTGAILAGSSQVSKEYMKWIESKNSWVNLISPD
jgi:hypothetical protein